jgi:hypothetical protein
VASRGGAVGRGCMRRLAKIAACLPHWLAISSWASIRAHIPWEVHLILVCCPNWIQPSLVLIWPADAGPRPPGFLLLAFDLPERYHPHYTLPALARFSEVEASSLAARVHTDSTHHRRKSGPEEHLLIRRPKIEHLHCQWLEMHLYNVFIYRLPTTTFSKSSRRYES